MLELFKHRISRFAQTGVDRLPKFLKLSQNHQVNVFYNRTSLTLRQLVFY